MSSSMSASSAALGSKLALHKVRFFASFLGVRYSRSRESVAIPFSLSLSFGGKFFLVFISWRGSRSGEMAEIFQARAAIKTRVNADKGESLSARKIERVSFVLSVLGSAVLRERNRLFFAIKKKRDTRETSRWFFRVDVTPSSLLGLERDHANF